MIVEIIGKIDTDEYSKIMPQALIDDLLLNHSLVRCKDCMLNTVNTDGVTENWCYKFGYAVESTDFCSYGERIE